MKGRRRMDEWSKFIPKIISPVTKIVFIYVPLDQHLSEDVTFNGKIPFLLLYTQIQEFATNKNPDTHPSTWFDEDAFKSRINGISADYERHKEQESILRDSGLISSWINSLSSFECLENEFVSSSSSVGVQTDEIFSLSVCPQSTPEKATQTRALLPQGRRTFLDEDDSFILDVSTPPAEPARKKNVDKRNLRNASLTLSEDPETSIHRRRIPWTLSETLALWHEVQEALPNPPSWAKIRDKVFASSRRTNVDLKDRWRVIQRDKALQKDIRLYYDKWLASKEKSPTK
nr:paramyosin [Hymenolepis microstoma]